MSGRPLQRRALSDLPLARLAGVAEPPLHTFVQSVLHWLSSALLACEVSLMMVHDLSTETAWSRLANPRKVAVSLHAKFAAGSRLYMR